MTSNINSKSNYIYKCKINNKISYLLLFLLLAFSGNPIFDQNKFLFLIFGAILFTIIFLTKIKFEINFKISLFQYILYFLIIFFLQLIVFSFVSLEGVINFCSKIVIGAVIVYLLGNSFREKYLNIMYFLCIISLIGFFVNLNGIKIPPLLQIDHRSTYLFFVSDDNFFDEGIMRNCGMFWEPGAYSGYLLLVPLLYMGDLKELWGLHKKKCIVLVATLLTTLSTTGYIILFLILIYSLIVKSGNKFFVYLILPFIAAGIFSIYTQVDFLGEKIESQFENSLDNSNNTSEFSPDRFGAFAFDLYYIKKHPLIGNGLHSTTRYSDHKYLVRDVDSGLISHGNGFSNFVASMGITSLLFYFYLIYKRFPFYKKETVFVIVIISLMLQGEQFLNFPLFLVLPFVQIPFKNEIEPKKNSRPSYLSQSNRQNQYPFI